MKIVIRIFSVLLVLAILIVLVSFFLPSKVHVERSKVITTSVENIFDQINNLKNWKNWDSWHKKDTAMTLNYSSESLVGVASWYTWDSQHDLGKGKVTIVESKPNEYVKHELIFGDDMKSMGEIRTQSDGNGTKVTLSFDSEIPENMPFHKKIFSKYMYAFAMDKFIGSEFEKSLDNMEALAKSMPEKPISAYKIEEVMMPSMKVISIKDSCLRSTLENKISSLFLELQILAAQNGIMKKGSSFVMFYNWTDEPDGVILIEPGFEVEEIAKEKILKLNNYELVSFKALKTTFNGPYGNIKSAHDDMVKLIDFEQMEISGPVMEIYKKGPMEEKDSANFITEIVYPVQ